MKIKIQFHSHTSHISSTQQPHVANEYYTKRWYTKFPSLQIIVVDSANLNWQLTFTSNKGS